jgi:excisionase family DNA binding protein
MLLSVQQAATRLGVSPVTVRRWTASGFLPCTRTAGGHRRIDKDDTDEIARAIGGSNHLAARLARERELETLVATAIALSSQLDFTELLAEIARQMTTLFDSHFCAISEYDPASRTVQVLADYDHSGRRLPDTLAYHIQAFPLTRKVIEEGTIELVNVDDPQADAAEVAELRREGDRSLLMVPLIVQGESVGLLELVDQKRARKYSRQELRLCRAIAGQAAVALHNAKAFAANKRSDQDVGALRAALSGLAAALPRLSAAATYHELLAGTATLACETLGAISCVAEAYGHTAGATAAASGTTSVSARGGSASVLTAAALCGPGELSLALTVPEPFADGATEVLGVIAAAAAAMLTRLPADG